ncbi:uncharacterized protein [Diadema setosum]|uniref:uncharacterized protein n=1 Tax=Diadema setosum TaxID=31175 RepID=UPI003B3A2385
MGFLTVVTVLVLAPPVLYILNSLLTSDPEPVLGIYSQRGRWFGLKYWLFYFMMRLRKRRGAAGRPGMKASEAGYGVKLYDNVQDMDKAQPLPPAYFFPKAVDAVYFNGSNKDGVYVVTAIARRQNQLANVLTYLVLPDVGVLQLPDHPGTTLEDCHPDKHSIAGLTIESVQAMKEWKISYKGKLRLVDAKKKNWTEGKLLDVSMEFRWTALTTYFDFDTDLDASLMADTIAREKWSRQFFEELKRSHQTHHEQFGKLQGTIEVEGHNKREVTLVGMRDHSYGNYRDWSELHRYAIHMLHLEDGTCIHAGKICYPRRLSCLTTGYVMRPGDYKATLTHSTFDMVTTGEKEWAIPDKYKFSFICGKERFDCEVEVQTAPVFYMGKNREAKLFEGFVHVVVNGKKGWGIAEYCYHNRDVDKDSS